MFLQILTLCILALLFLGLCRFAMIVFQGNPIFIQQSRGLGVEYQIKVHGLAVIPVHQAGTLRWINLILF